MSGEEARTLLEPHYPAISECIAAGWDAWQSVRQAAPNACLPLETRTWAGLVHDNIVAHAQRRFSGMGPGVVVSSACGFLTIDFHGKIILRFKKLRKNLRPSNVATGQQDDFRQQQLFSSVATKVTAGYRVDALGTIIRDIQIVCWLDSHLNWSLRMPDLCGDTGVAQPMSPDAPRKPLVVAKKSTKKATGSA